MKNLTVALPEAVLDRLRLLAAERKISVNRFVGQVLSDIAVEPANNWQEEHEALLREIGTRSRSASWNREEIYAERAK